jgi:hypothetical protein
MTDYDSKLGRELDSDLDVFIAAKEHKMCGNNNLFSKKILAVMYCKLAATPCTVQICPNYLAKQVRYLARNRLTFTGPIPCKFPC